VPYKGAYNLAVANGLDPQSIGDPFPPGLLLPSWYSQRVIGPQFKTPNGDLWGGNPTGPLGDVLDQFGSDIKPKDFTGWDAWTKTAGTFLNMSNPFFKAPAEIMMGRTLQTGTPIPDNFEYLGDMVGPVRTASHITGKVLTPEWSPDGHIGLPNRTEAKYAKGMNGDQWTANAIPEAINYLTGGGFTNYSSNGTQKAAQFQTKDNNIQAKKEAQRFK
jgi:hypothetical protein